LFTAEINENFVFLFGNFIQAASSQENTMYYKKPQDIQMRGHFDV